MGVLLSETRDFLNLFAILKLRILPVYVNLCVLKLTEETKFAFVPSANYVLAIFKLLSNLLSFIKSFHVYLVSIFKLVLPNLCQNRKQGSYIKLK